MVIAKPVLPIPFCTLRAPRGMPRGPGSIGSPPPPPLAPHLLNPCRSPTPSKTEGNTGSVQPWPTPTALSTCGKCCAEEASHGALRRYIARVPYLPRAVPAYTSTPAGPYTVQVLVFFPSINNVLVRHQYIDIFYTSIVTQAGGAARARRTCGSRPIY